MEEKDQKTATISSEDQHRVKEKELLAGKYRAKGAQTLSLKQYLELEAKKKKALKPKVPAYLKFILATPFIIVSCFGAVYIPYMLYQIATGKSTAATEQKKSAKDLSLDDLMKKAPDGEPVRAK